MSIHNPITDEMVTKLSASIENAASAQRDPDKMRSALAEMDRSREDLRKRVGILNVAVELIREVRDQCD